MIGHTYILEKGENKDAVEHFYPGKILGFVKFDETTEAVIQCTERPLR